MPSVGQENLPLVVRLVAGILLLSSVLALFEIGESAHYFGYTVQGGIAVGLRLGTFAVVTLSAIGILMRLRAARLLYTAFALVNAGSVVGAAFRQDLSGIAHATYALVLLADMLVVGCLWWNRDSLSRRIGE